MDPKNNLSRLEKKLKDAEKGISASEQAVHFDREKEKPEKKEPSQYDSIITDELKREIELMQLDENSKDEAKKKAEKIQFLGQKDKIEHLLQIAKEKGLVFAIQVAKKMNDPYILDVLHDILAKEGYYKEFIKK